MMSRSESLRDLPERILVNKRDAARMLSISLRTLDYLIFNQELSVRRIGRRVLIPRRVLEEFARRDHPMGMEKR